MSEIEDDQSNAKIQELIHPDVRVKMEKLLEEMGISGYTFDVDKGSGKGDNYLGVIAKATISGKDKNGENVHLDWIIKSAPTMNIMRNNMNVVAAYDREIFVYETIFPLYKTFQRERELIDPFDSFPDFVMSNFELLKETLVLKDMKAIGYVMRDRKQPLDYNHVRLVMKAYGKFHAISYALRDQRPEEFTKLAAATPDSFFKESMQSPETVEYIARFAELTLSALDPVKDARAHELFKKFKANQLDISNEVLSFKNSYSVIGHGDSWVNNMLFAYKNHDCPDIPTNVCLLDWQLARYGSPALDLSYFIFTCTDKTLRERHYHDMIRLYYYTLCAHLVDLGSDPGKLISFDALQAELKKCSVFGLHISIMVIYMMLSEVEEIPDVDDNTSPEDLKDAYNYQSKNEHIFKERVRGLVLDFVELGYLDFLE